MPRIQVYFTDSEYKRVKEKPVGWIRNVIRLALIKKENDDKGRPVERED
jgi:hypothetical protein